MAQLIKNPPANAGDARDAVSTPGMGRFPGEVAMLQYLCLENSMERGACYGSWGHKESDMMDSMH